VLLIYFVFLSSVNVYITTVGLYELFWICLGLDVEWHCFVNITDLTRFSHNRLNPSCDALAQQQ